VSGPCALPHAARPSVARPAGNERCGSSLGLQAELLGVRDGPRMLTAYTLELILERHPESGLVTELAIRSFMSKSSSNRYCRVTVG